MRRSSLLAPMFVVLPALALLPSAQANPLPGSLGIFAHVQPVNENWCQENSISDCYEIRQYSTATGVVEFDIYGVNYMLGPDDIMYGLSVTMQWPSTWTFVEWETCNDGVGALDLVGDGGQLNVQWEHCPTIGTAPFLIGRLLLSVNAPGTLEFPGQSSDIVLYDCPPSTWSDFPFGNPAMAGVECAYCYTTCELESPNWPHLDEHRVDLQAQQGETASSAVEGRISSTGWIEVEGTAPWLTGELEWIGDHDFVITMTADAGTMPPGVYEGWLRARSGCTDCARVTFTVLPSSQGVEEPAVEPASWGEIKSRYR